MTRLLILLSLLAVGCHMTNDQIIAEVKKCKEAGLDYHLHQGTRTGAVYAVTCVPKESKRQERAA